MVICWRAVAEIELTEKIANVDDEVVVMNVVGGTAEGVFNESPILTEYATVFVTITVVATIITIMKVIELEDMCMAQNHRTIYWFLNLFIRNQLSKEA